MATHPGQLQNSQGLQNAYNAQLNQLGRYQNPTHRYMIDGRMMDFEEFVNTVFPNDCPEKTFFLLKHSKDTDVKST